MTDADAADLLRRAGVDGGEARKLRRLAEDTGRLFDDLVKRRVAREPFSHIAGYRDFWSHRFRVNSHVLDPRPETELLVELALEHPFSKVLDLGTGSGCIVISLLAERPEARGVGTDVSEKAVLLAGENAAEIGVADRLVLPLSDWFEDVGGRYDLIVSNPPYIRLDDMPNLAPEVRDYEPHGALTDDGDGLSAYRAISEGASDHLVEGGRLLVEIGADQAEAVREIFSAAGLADVAVHTDLNGKDRVVAARRRS